MRVLTDSNLVREWIALQYADEGSEEYEAHFDAYSLVWEMTHECPEEAWAFILAVLENDGSDLVMANLSAGSLEDLLVYHGSAVIDRVEVTAKANPNFALPNLSAGPDRLHTIISDWE